MILTPAQKQMTDYSKYEYPKPIRRERYKLSPLSKRRNCKLLIPWTTIYTRYTYNCFRGKCRIDKTDYKVTFLSPGQVEAGLHYIKELRNQKKYKKADEYRDRLIKIGYFYKEFKNPTPRQVGNLEDKLQFQVLPDGRLSLKGYIYFREDFGSVDDNPIPPKFEFEYIA